MEMALDLISRAESAAMLAVTENTARALERAGAITAVVYVGRRPLFSAKEVQALKVKRDAIESARRKRWKADTGTQGRAA